MLNVKLKLVFGQFKNPAHILVPEPNCCYGTQWKKGYGRTLFNSQLDLENNIGHGTVVRRNKKTLHLLNMPRKVMAALVNLYFIRFNCSVLQALKHCVQILKLSFPAVLEESVWCNRNTSCQVYLPAAQYQYHVTKH